jgi:phage terminase large subunit-like protein
MTPGNVIDYAFIKKAFWLDCQKFKIEKCAFDRWGFEALRQQFMAEGAPEEMFIAFGQGFASMSAPTKEIEKLILAEKLIHSNNPVLRWMASNIVVEQDAASNIKPNKKKSPEKIDGIVMTIMALGLAITVPPEEPSVYETRGPIFL